MANPRTLVVVGNGMVGHKLVESLVAAGQAGRWRVVVFAEEPRPAYDRVGLSSLFAGATPSDLNLVPPTFFSHSSLALHLADPVVAIDREARTVTSAAGTVVAYDALVLATGSSPFVPPVPGADLPGCFVYRTIEDLEAIRAWATSRAATGPAATSPGPGSGAVVGGGLLGLEAANALQRLGLQTHVVELAPRLMAVQVDEGGGTALRQRVEELGVVVHTGAQTEAVVAGAGGAAATLRFADGGELDVAMVVFSAGIRPRDQLARAAGLQVGPRGGIVVDPSCRTSDPAVFAIGECALAGGRIYGLMSPGYQMARVVADQLAGGGATFEGADCSTKLKLLGVDVASFGDAHGTTPGARAVTFADAVSGTYKKLVLDPSGAKVLGGVLVGDASMYQPLAQMALGAMPTPAHPEELIFPGRTATAVAGVGALADTATICSCENVAKGSICAAIATSGLSDVAGIKAATRAGTGCGGCVPLLGQLLRDELLSAGVEMGNDLCEHFVYSRQELFDIVRIERLHSFSELLARHGRGRGCEVCKPAVASMLASLDRGHILDGEAASLQDTNDAFLANIQRDGTYSIVPRVPGGEITPEKLIVLGQVALDFGLYTKITGAQRVDLFGARVDQLPAIWSRLVAAGFESGHAYGKALRTVKSCVGSTWCRYGVQDSTTLAIDLELRYRGLRSPHKLKSAVSGCTRECAEAQSKDFGVIATERGWNLYVCGNGGMKPQHAQLLASDLDPATLVAYIDRFLMFYIRTADRLQRTASWLNQLEGGIDYLRRVVCDDALGLAAELEADMAAHVAAYECEWKATVSDPARLRRFHHFVNSDRPDPAVAKVALRDQHRPARPDEAVPVALPVRVLAGAGASRRP